MFFITISRIANDIDFVKYAGLQVSSFLFAYIANMEQLQAAATLAATGASFILSIAGIALVWYKVRLIKKDLEK